MDNSKRPFDKDQEEEMDELPPKHSRKNFDSEDSISEYIRCIVEQEKQVFVNQVNAEFNQYTDQFENQLSDVTVRLNESKIENQLLKAKNSQLSFQLENQRDSTLRLRGQLSSVKGQLDWVKDIVQDAQLPVVQKLEAIKDFFFRAQREADLRKLEMDAAREIASCERVIQRSQKSKKK